MKTIEVNKRIKKDAQDGRGFTEKEITELSKVLDAIEHDAYYYISGGGHISGAYSESEVWNYDDDIIDVELKYGIQDECTNVVHTENLKLNRHSWKCLN